MVYRVAVSYDTESENWEAVGDYDNLHLAMQAHSLDVLIERSNLALVDLIGRNKLTVVYCMNQELEIDYA